MALNFERAPEVPLWKLLLKKTKKLGPGDSIPRMEATARSLSGDLEAFRRVCGYARSNPLPLTWPALLAQPLQLAIFQDPAFPLPVTGIVHTRQQIRWRRPLQVDEPLSARCLVEGHRVVRSGGEFDLQTTIFSGEEVVYEATTTILSRAIRGNGEEKQPPPEKSFPWSRSTTWKVPADQGRRYAAVSGDYNPIHISWLGARLFGFPRPIVHGWWTLGRAIAELDDDLPPSGRLEVRFVSPIPLPSKVSFHSGRQGDVLHFAVAGKKPCLVAEIHPL